jgi:galactokinase/mevalonate kinase-like predicted kinase
MDAAEDDLWSKETPSRERLIWNARVFPASTTPEGFRDWLWMFTPAAVSPGQRAAWRAADRFSFAEMLGLASQEEFHRRRLVHHAGEIRANVMQKFRLESGFSASELAFILTLLNPERRAQWVAEILQQCSLHFGGGEPAPGLERLELSRILHTLGSAIQKGAAEGDNSWKTLADDVFARLSGKERNFLASLGLTSGLPDEVQMWTMTLRDKAFENIGRTIVMSREKPPVFPRNALRADEIIWGRAPARLDLGGGWSDTPPYALENGGCVINAAVNLNGQPPIHAYARVIEEPEIRISSIDHGVQIVIRELAELMDYRSPVSKFGLAKATLALCGFAPETAAWPREAKTLRKMLELFGGGIELTTLAAIPSGSGLGTSSIMGAVLVAVVHRMVGRPLQTRELFHNVLRLEQELTTGGGWQDQVGGVLTGVKMITTEPGLVPNPFIQYVPPDVLDPRANGGQTLLYYTGLRRLAKNILRDVVGSYLDRDRTGMETLRQIHAFPPRVLEAMAAKNIERFGEVLGAAWDLKKQIDPASTTEVIEKILNRVGRLIHGAKLMGAGGGGFLLLVCRSAEAARAVRQELENDPPNDRARFFEFDISLEGLAVTAS